MAAILDDRLAPGAPFDARAREDFRDAIARHRRAAWRVTAACLVAYTVLGGVVAVLMAPLLWCLLGLALDLINLAMPTPDLLAWAGRELDGIIDPKGPLSARHLAEVALVAGLPGLGLVTLAGAMLRRALRASPLLNLETPPGRAADPTRLAEQQFANTVEEMAIAAGIAAPRVRFVQGAANAAALGSDEDCALVLVGTQMADCLSRAQMQAVAAHLVAMIAEGDLRIGLRAALVIGVFALCARFGAGWGDRQAFANAARLLTALITPTQASLQRLLAELSDPFAPAQDKPGRAARRAARDTNRLTWREWASMPLMGPVALAGFLAGLVSQMLLGPLVSLAWRQRKYMADASAVRLTRDPDALADALQAGTAAEGTARIEAWAGPLCVVDAGWSAAGLMGRPIVPVMPALSARLRALVRLGAQPRALPDGARLPLPTLLLLSGLGTVAVALLCVASVLLVWLSCAISMLFTVLPASMLHFLLR